VSSKVDAVHQQYLCEFDRTCAKVTAVDKQSISNRWGAGVETQKNVRGEVGGWGRVPFNEPYASKVDASRACHSCHSCHSFASFPSCAWCHRCRVT